MTNQTSTAIATILVFADDGTHTEIDGQGAKIWRNADGQIHRDGDYPAVIQADGSVYYYQNGELHRDGGLPAILQADGKVRYYMNGVSCKFVVWEKIIKDVVFSLIGSIILLSLVAFLTH